MSLRRSATRIALAALLCGVTVVPSASARRVEERTPLFTYLHVIQPIQQQAVAAQEAGKMGAAYRLYLRALRQYQALDRAAGDWYDVRPAGLQQLVREGLAECEVAVKALRSAAEQEDVLLQRLTQQVNFDVKDMDIREAVKLLSTLTDVNIVVDDTLFPQPGPDPNVTLRVDREVPLLQVIRLLVQQKGLAYAIEEDYVYISSRTRIDGAAGFSSSAWFRPE